MFNKLTPTIRNNQASDACTQQDSAATATAQHLNSFCRGSVSIATLYEQLNQVEHLFVGWTGKELKASAAFA
ncbi:hypothetical protein [Kamptonema sp. UHCC 0994]|uniref:hypothetical protein n=1 Tax=Kamptonema sp. UHCC 0994 TaxID=3031329 RepID=UPI0023B8FB2E|nr:hypothetical protein [Kamptonema sp. UHCC 0994]MDF0552013.1 hypothetical protein [Kamptonema sp. UHCC 0994]